MASPFPWCTGSKTAASWQTAQPLSASTTMGSCSYSGSTRGIFIFFYCWYIFPPPRIVMMTQSCGKINMMLIDLYQAKFHPSRLKHWCAKIHIFQECDQGRWRLVSLWSFQPEWVHQVWASVPFTGRYWMKTWAVYCFQSTVTFSSILHHLYGIFLKLYLSNNEYFGLEGGVSH